MKNVLITGATGGIGDSLVEVFHENDFNIIASGTNDEKLKKLSLKYPNRLKIVKCDLSKEKDINYLYDQISEYCGSVDILINNAGITKDNVFLSMKKEQWDDVINVNLNSNFIRYFFVPIKSGFDENKLWTQSCGNSGR